KPDAKEPNRRVTGSSNIPLNDQGRAQAQQLAERTAGQFTRIEHSPMDRAAETAQIVGAANPQAQVAPAEGLSPWDLGEHEGQPVETEKDAINDRVRNAPDEAPPGRGEQSTDDGEPFNEFRGRTVDHLKDQILNLKPGETVLNITHGRDMRLVDSWLKNGAPEDGSVDVDHMTKDGDWSGEGDLFRVKQGGLESAEDAKEPGIYYARHGATDWSIDEANKEDRSEQNGPESIRAALPSSSVESDGTERDQEPQTPAAYGQQVVDTTALTPRRLNLRRPVRHLRLQGRGTNVAVPGESTSYPARYAVRELADVQASHNPFNFQRNPDYAYTNDRDYSRSGNAARVIKNAAPGTFNPEFITTDAPTAEHGSPVIDAHGNVLGGNSRTMTLAQVYQRGGPDAALYRQELKAKAQQFGIDPAELDRFDKPVLVREVGGGHDAQKMITDFKKAVRDAFSGGSGERGSADLNLMTLGGQKFVERDVIPTVKRVAGDLVEAKDQALRLVAPQLRGEAAEYTGLSLRQRMAQFARRYDQGAERLKAARDFFNKRSADDNYKFIDDIEQGRKTGDDNLDAIAGTFRRMLDQRRQEVQALGEGELQRFYQNYFPHIFERPEQAGKFFQSFFSGKRSMEGPKAFLQHREFPTFREALDAGQKPVTDNPVELVMLKAREMDRYLLAHAVLRDIADRGIAKRVSGPTNITKPAQSPDAQYYLRPAYEVAKKEDLPPDFISIRDPIGGGRWYAEQGAADVLNNYLTPGLRAKSGAYRIAVGINNTMNQANLGLSAFHLTGEIIRSGVSRAALGIEDLIHGNPIRGSLRIASAPAG
ncbi:MAG TPA: histidine phosphatase family protein, partial [Bryobacteraceae bacterium]|nr:histidine phosphatase family protein [Bryobacteraceae bacterium]